YGSRVKVLGLCRVAVDVCNGLGDRFGRFRRVDLGDRAVGRTNGDGHGGRLGRASESRRIAHVAADSLPGSVHSGGVAGWVVRENGPMAGAAATHRPEGPHSGANSSMRLYLPDMGNLRSAHGSQCLRGTRDVKVSSKCLEGREIAPKTKRGQSAAGTGRRCSGRREVRSPNPVEADGGTL